MSDMNPRSGQSIPDDVLRRICEHRPELAGYAENLKERPETAQMVEKMIADQYLMGESRLSAHETTCLAKCSSGEAYGSNAGHELMAEDEADRGTGRRGHGPSERLDA